MNWLDIGKKNEWIILVQLKFWQIHRSPTFHFHPEICWELLRKQVNIDLLDTASASAMKSSSSSLVSIVPSNIVTVFSSFMSMYPSPGHIVKSSQMRGWIVKLFMQPVTSNVIYYVRQNTTLPAVRLNYILYIINVVICLKCILSRF